MKREKKKGFLLIGFKFCSQKKKACKYYYNNFVRIIKKSDRYRSPWRRITNYKHNEVIDHENKVTKREKMPNGKGTYQHIWTNQKKKYKVTQSKKAAIHHPPTLPSTHTLTFSHCHQVTVF